MKWVWIKNFITHLDKLSNNTNISNRKNETKRFSNKIKTLDYISRVFKNLFFKSFFSKELCNYCCLESKLLDHRKLLLWWKFNPKEKTLYSSSFMVLFPGYWSITTITLVTIFSNWASISPCFYCSSDKSVMLMRVF